MKPNQKISKELAEFDVKRKQELLKQLGIASEQEVSLKALHKLLRSKEASIEVKSTACSLIQIARNKKSIGVLIEVFNDKNQYLANGAMLALAGITSDRALEFLIKTLRSSSEQSSRRNAAYALASYFDNEKAVDALMDALNDKTQSPETRAQAAEGLGTLSATRATQTLVANLDDPSFEVRSECVWALGQVGMDAAVIPELERFLGDKSKVGDWTMDEEANEAIKFIKARVAALENYTGDKSKVDIWTIHTETLQLVEEMKKIETTNTTNLT